LFWKKIATYYENQKEHKYIVWEKCKDFECRTQSCHYGWRNWIHT